MDLITFANDDIQDIPIQFETITHQENVVTLCDTAQSQYIISAAAIAIKKIEAAVAIKKIEIEAAIEEKKIEAAIEEKKIEAAIEEKKIAFEVISNRIENITTSIADVRISWAWNRAEKLKRLEEQLARCYRALELRSCDTMVGTEGYQASVGVVPAEEAIDREVVFNPLPSLKIV